MDRFVLQGLVRQIEPELAGAQVKAVLRRPDGLSLLLRTRGSKNRRLLSAGFRVSSPMLALVDPPKPSAPKTLEASIGFRKKLEASRFQTIQVMEHDRIARVDFERLRPSGRAELVSLVCEWIGPSSAVYVLEIDRSVGEETIVDLFSVGRARQARGEAYRSPRAPASAERTVPADAGVLVARLGSVEKLSKKRLRDAGIPPPMDSELIYRVEKQGLSVEQAFDELLAEISNERVELVTRRNPSLATDQTPICRVAAFSMRHRSDTFDSEPVGDFNEAMRRCLEIESRWLEARHLYLRMSKWLKPQQKRLVRLRAKLLKEQDDEYEPETLRRFGELLLAGQHGAELTDPDADGRRFAIVADAYDLEAAPVRIPLDPRYNLLRNADRYFSRAAKSERRRERHRTRLNKIEHEIDYFESSLLSLNDLEDSEDMVLFERELRADPHYARFLSELGSQPQQRQAARNQQKRLPPRQFMTRSGKTVLAGRSSRSNEYLSFRTASSSDRWFHVQGMPGAHVLLRLGAQETPSPEDCEDAAGVAAYYSSARASSYVEVMMAEPRHLSKIKGAPEGTVRVSTYTSLRVKPALPEAVNSHE